ncbi:MAG TPA: TetR/AcrR family transcriptional regulator [Polyangiaceae bacterium]|nr:TetR/AcrR family transcriptional regulator [Polyangiaceae bacterium]
MTERPRRPRGRPLSFDRDEALDRVLPVFWRKGFGGTSLDELAAAAGLNRPNLAAAFGDKRALYLAALRRFGARLSGEAAAALASPGPLRAGLEAYFDRAAALYTGEGLGCFVFATAPAASGDEPEVRSALAEAFAGLDAALERRVAAAVRAGELPADVDAPGLATALSGVLLNLALRARAGASEAELRALHRHALAAMKLTAAEWGR